MPLWAAIAVGVGAFLALAALGVGGYFAWRAYTKRILLRLVGRTEAVESTATALVDVLTRLAEAEDSELTDFANDPESGERRALHEVALKARMLTDEVDAMPLPRPLLQLAESLADTAYVVGVEASRVTADRRGHEALEELAGIDLESVRAYIKQTRYRLNELCGHYGLVDTAVYGGGLYL